MLLLPVIKPVIPATKFDGEKSRVCGHRCAHQCDAGNRGHPPPILEHLENKGNVKIIGAIYDLSTGTVEFLS